MKMKQLLRYTSSLLRTVLLLGVIAFVNTQQSSAQPVSLTADMPDAFETKTPTIGDGQYYFIQFYREETYSPYIYQSFLGELGEGEQMHAMDYLPFAANRLWTLVPGSDENHFKLKSKRGFYAYWDNAAARFKTTATESNASDFRFKNRGSYRAGFKELLTTYAGADKSICRNASNEWGEIINSTSNAGYVRFAQLKANAAHIIYYRQEGVDNNAPQALTTRHYLTYSGTDNRSEWNFRSSMASSRQSIIPSDKSLWTLPTAAAYHLDGLWALEETGDDGEFFIKKHGTESYLSPVHDSFDYLNLGEKDNTSGKYILETPTANRYTRIQNEAEVTENLTANMFNAELGFHVGEQITDDQATSGYTIVGDGNVSETIFADLSDYSKMTINGTQNMRLRVLMSRQADGNRPWVEKNVTIGSDGTAEVDLTNLTLNQTQTTSATVKMTHVDGSNANVDISYGDETSKQEGVTAGYNNGYDWNHNGPGYYISKVELGNNSWGVNNIIYLQVDAHAIEGTIAKVTLKANASGNGDRETEWGAGYNNMEWTSTMTWNSVEAARGRNITDLTPVADRPTVPRGETQQISLDITGAFTNNPDKIATIVVYETRPGGGTFSNPTVEVEYYPSVSYAHLNAIKTDWNSSGGTISSITLTKIGNRYLHHAQGDGWQTMLWPGGDSGDWYAGFYPVEVPASQKDEFFQVRLVLNPPNGAQEAKSSIVLNNMTEGMGRTLLPGVTESNITGATYTPTGDFQRCFWYTNLTIPQGCNKIIVKFAEPVVGNWNISGIVNGNQTWEAIPEGSMWYEMDLAGQTSIDDLAIFNWEGERNPISIAEVYFYSGSMINENGCSVSISEYDPILWQLEQENDYQIFRLKNENEEYLNGNCSTTNDPNNNNAKYSNQRLISDFSLKWFIPQKEVQKEIPVNHYVRHKESYLRAYADDQVITDQTGLKKQGLATDIDSDWWNFDGNGFQDDYSLNKGTQKTNHFEITHYLKKGDSKVIEFPTVLNKNNDHIFYQRFYNYDESDTNMDLDNLKAHVNLDIRNDGEVQYFLYKNGMVTGEKLNWTDIEGGDLVRKEQRRFNFTNSDGQRFTVGVDVSRYSDLEYLANGDLREPSLTMRYLFLMRDAKEMAANLTACTYGSDKWLEEKEIHFGRTQVPYTKFKKVGYRGEFIGLRHLFSDYWVFDGNGTDDANLVSAVNDDDSGKIEVEIYDPRNTGIRKGGYNPNIDLNSQGTDEGNDSDYQGFYLYDLLSPSPKHEYGNSRFVVFRYPAADENGIVQVKNCGPDNPAYLRVYLNNNGTRYQLAQYTIIFDANMATRPWTEIKNGTHYANGTDLVKGTYRDPNKLRERAGEPIAKITFDYPTGTDKTYHFPSSGSGQTRHDGGVWEAGGTIPNSSPVPLTFDNTNYAFDGDGCNWGSYTIVTQKMTTWGNNKIILPADDATHGYDIKADDGMQKAFMYIDASEQPGDICVIDFQGDFCAGDQLLCSGWISGCNKIQNDTRCPGSITLTVKGKDNNSDEIKTIYRFCPGQIYELDNGYQMPGGDTENVAGIDGNGNGATHVVWQQFFFEFSTAHKYDHYWLEVNNNCVSSNGGDFMLDNIEVYALVPEVEPEINTPLCVTIDAQGNPKTEMRLLKLNVEYNKLVNSANENKLGFVFLEKDVFLKKIMDEKNLQSTYPTLEALAEAIDKDDYLLADNDPALMDAIDAALLGDKKIWDSTAPSTNMGGGILYFDWSTNFDEMESYSFAKAVNKYHQESVFRYVDDDYVKWLVLNGNYPELPWKTETEYYIVPTNEFITNVETGLYRAFNICSKCSKASVFKINSPYTVLGLESSETTNDYVVCEGQIPTILLDLKGFTLDGKEVDMKNLNFDWWLGNSTTKATLTNYHTQNNGSGIKLDKALATFRTYYSDVNTLNGLKPKGDLTQAMLDYLQSLVDAGELVLHQTSINVPAEPASDVDPYFYLVACPIHDAMFNQALNPKANEYVSYFCDEPQGLRVKVGQKAPTLKTGFVPGEHGFDTYDYNFPEGTDPVLSIRLAKAAQFETVKNTVAEAGAVSASVNYLWLPIRNAMTQTADGVIKKADDDNIYLASSNDPTWDKKIYSAMSKTGSLPVVGRIVQLNAINTSNKTEDELNNDQTFQASNRLCVYFTENFEVREGYNYTLSLPFQEQGDVNTCNGTILINLKIVPDYEVWTGAAGNTIPDWNNDENWRRADGNTESTSGLNEDELYVGAATYDSPLNGYKTNAWNYRTPKDRVFRKGFAPLYCTHVLIKGDEWGNAPVLYDAIDNHDVIAATGSRLINVPFPNLRDTSTPILKFDMQARRYDMWNDTYGTDPDRGDANRPKDLIAEMYQINSCDEIVFQPGTELQKAHLLNYNSAWMEYELDTKRWYLLGSPLQGTISGEWYAPTGDSPQQKTTYYDPVIFNDSKYDRYSPAIYQRSWDKAKAVLYEVGAAYAKTDDEQTNQNDDASQGQWGDTDWNAAGADDYLDRLGYKPFGEKKANVAIKGIWSNTYNDAQVDYATGGFSVMVMNHLKGNVADVKAIIRLPKEDVTYKYWSFDKDVSGTDTDVSDVQTKDRADGTKRATNRGRLKTDLLLPTQEGVQKLEKEVATGETYRYVDRRSITRIPIKETALYTMNNGDFSFTEKMAAGASDLGYYLVENPFPCGLNMSKFFEENTNLETKYWLLTKSVDGQNPRQVLVQQAGDEWVSTTDESKEYINPEGGDNLMFYPHAVVAPGQGFFVQAKTGVSGDIDITFTPDMQTQSRFGVIDGAGREFEVVIGQSQRTKKMYDADDDGIPDTEVDNPNDYEGGELITVNTINGPVEKTVVIVPVYEDGLDSEGNRIPVLDDIKEKVRLYSYKQERMTLVDQSTVDKAYPLLTRGEEAETILPGLVITAQRGNDQSSALVMQREGASNDFLPEEDTETFITSDLEQVPTVYTLCGRLATTINSIHDFRSLSIGVESNSDAPCTLTFQGVEMLGDSIAFYDAIEKTLIPLESGMTISVSGQTQNRYYLVRGLNLKEAAEETHLQIFTEGLTAKVIASTAEPILVVRCFDTSGRLLYTANPDSAEHSFTLPGKGIYIIEAQTENDRKTIKVMTK